MSECEPISFKKRVNQDRPGHPSHSLLINDMASNNTSSSAPGEAGGDLSTEDSDANVKSTEVHLPNGVTRLSPDSNGFVSNSLSSELSQQKNIGPDEDNCTKRQIGASLNRSG